MDPVTGLFIATQATNILSQLGAAYVGAQASEDATEADLEALQAIMDRVDTQWTDPQFDKTPFTPEEMRVLDKFVPEVSQFVAEKAPVLIQGAGQQEYIQSQKEALNTLKQLSQSGFDPATQAAMEQARFQSDQASKAQRSQLLSQLAARGVTGQEVVSSLGQQQDLDTQARQAYLQAAQQGQARRMQALQEYANLAGQMRGSAAQQEQANVGIMNDFNQRATMSRRQWENQKTQQANEARLLNIQQAQQIANQNVQARNTAAQFNKDRADRIAQIAAASKNQKLQTIADLMDAQRKAESAGILREGQNMAQGISGLGQAGAGFGSAMYERAGKKELAAMKNPTLTKPNPNEPKYKGMLSDDEEE